MKQTLLKERRHGAVWRASIRTANTRK